MRRWKHTVENFTPWKKLTVNLDIQEGKVHFFGIKNIFCVQKFPDITKAGYRLESYTQNKRKSKKK